ncbi:hypothetical protein SDC9_180531 [bioreactor metagenome]|uniref:Uncharacterized protein n=1 Tax=bioreactor metagenome TaxID=1076179 RepID=A0A645H213_9ZZZZ
MDIDGPRQGSRYASHGYGQPQGGSHVKHFIHQGQTAGAGGRRRPGSRRLGADAGRHGTVLRFHRNEQGFRLAVGHIL